MGWASERNGELLRLAVADGFDAFLTVDRKLRHQQNLSAFNIAVVVLEASGNTLADLRPLAPTLLEVLPSAPRGRATVVSSRAEKDVTD
jgi:hypothetical protein